MHVNYRSCNVNLHHHIHTIVILHSQKRLECRRNVFSLVFMLNLKQIIPFKLYDMAFQTHTKRTIANLNCKSHFELLVRHDGAHFSIGNFVYSPFFRLSLSCCIVPLRFIFPLKLLWLEYMYKTLGLISFGNHFPMGNNHKAPAN